ncbi:MAG TPA: ATP-binding cassette domain-containing protein [Spirochaetota bacterium]|nr:ATP-binding cassette domain-containing protein [Spirochaetota bacterium]HNT09852.1 ATP-binding cassette domain-containing protein [Spirochaetota bacterium]HNV47448.1 ATP-binding cassette domain-containing protein [Spirochaetota bacterium]HOS38101.1 ATP-binding cassette domain-containing protein [Spirochaetota bacterium]HPI23820.1 ATP-binding cassette domain-containing protein [Spirochaetota bacterium]
MVRVAGLTKHFSARKSGFFERPGVVRAVDDIGFTIEAGKTLGMVGESGSGKTTAARSMLRLIEPDAGEVVINGRDVLRLPPAELRSFRRNMQIVFQDPYGSLNPRMTAGKIITEPLRIHRSMEKSELASRLRELLELVGLSPEHADRYPHEFSGGQRQRIGIARAIALNPAFIILDEPVSALDVSIQGQILNLLRDLQEKLGLTFLFVAHDLAVVEHMSDRIAVMYLGKIVEESARTELYREPLHPYTASLLTSIPTAEPSRKGFAVLPGEIPSPEDPPAGCHFHPRCPKVMDTCRSVPPPMKEVGGRRVACHLY